MSPEEVLHNELESLMEDIKQKHIDLKMKATGAWIRSLEVKVSTIGGNMIGSVMGLDYSKYLIHGRGPGKRPPIHVIEAWMRAKRIRPRRESMTSRALAFLIARKIGQQGTKYFREGGTKLISSIVTPSRVEEIMERVGEAVSKQLQKEVETSLETL